MAWDQTKPVYKSPLISNDIRENWAALYDMLSVEHDFFRGTHKALTLPSNGLTVGSTLILTNNKVLVGYSVDQDGTSLLQVNGAGYFTYGLKFGDGSTQTTASPSTSYVASTYAPLVSPSLTGVPLAPTAAQNTNTTQIATTAYYIGQAGTATPLMAGIASVGTSYLFARQDHKHPTDTSNFSASDPLMNGIATAGNATTYARSNHVHPTDVSRAPIDSPSFTGVPLVPTAALGTNTTQAASTAFVKATIDAIIGAAPGTLDTLNELAAALGNDPNFATTITNSLAGKLSLSGGILTGDLGLQGGSSPSNPTLEFYTSYEVPDGEGGYTQVYSPTGTGIYSLDSSDLGFSIQQVSVAHFNPNGMIVSGSVTSSSGYVFPDGKSQLKAFQGLQTNGTNVTQRSKINFVGPYVSLSDDSINDVSTVTIGGNQGVPTVQYFSGNNSQTIFTLSAAPLGKDYTDVHIGGTYIPKSAYSLSGTTLTFNTAPATGTNNIEVEWSTPLPISVPATNSVTSDMLVDNIALRGTPTAPTPILGDNSTRIATTAFLEEKFATLGDMATQNSADIHVALISIGNGEFDTPSLRFGSQGTGLWSPAGDTIAISNGYTETLRITPSKALLLGRINYVASSEKLSVNGLGAFGTASYTIIGDDGTNSIIGSYSNKDLIFKTNNTEVGRFTSTGKLQLNTLYSSGSVGIFTDADVNAALALGKASGAGQYNIYASGTAQNYLAGFTGIGTSNPTTLFDVSGGARIRGSLEVGNTSEFWFNSYYNGGNKFRTSGYATRILQDTSGNFSFSNTISGTADEAVSWLERFRISAAGNLLIGTTTDDGTNKLQVNGAVTATSFNSITGLATTAPLSNTGASVGVSTKAAREDHRHAAPVNTINGTGFVKAAGTTLSYDNTTYQPASTAITTSNIGSQSVNYSTSAGNADTLDGLHASSFASSSPATESAAGVVELATAAEALAGTDTERAVTSAGLASAKLLSTNGYQKLPGGLILQWGRSQYTTNTWNTTTFPITFPTACQSISMIIEYAGANGIGSFQLNQSSLPTTSSFQHYQGGGQSGIYFRWLAIGY